MAKRIFQEKLKVIANKRISQKYFQLTFASAKIASFIRPGQFIEIKITDTVDPLLRRPLSVHQAGGNSLSVLCEIVGKGTQILSQKKTGEYLDIIGPLGNGFSLKTKLKAQGARILVAGGIGVAPLVFLAEELKQPHTKVLIGAKTKRNILCQKEFKKIGCDVRIATDDGSAGFKGRVTGLLKQILLTTYLPAAIYACGPKPMLRELAYICKDYKIPAEISLEAHMSCGFGACLGCAVNTKTGFQRVCLEGPVFKAEDLILDDCF
ncbi:MAG: dihydroorotate dehydrogenase electron transfer subunit [Candidatus Omnitrophota bacterium]